MFGESRYDPRTEDPPKKKRKRRSKGEAKETEEPKLQVIAPKVEEREVAAAHKVGEEAFDDLGLVDIVKDSDIYGNKEYELASEEIEKALELSKLPIQEAAKRLGIAPFLVRNLEKVGFTNFFPIQALVLPDVIQTERLPHIRARDVCISAPTGSGKTLAFVLPILNSLASRKIRRLRALVILPSRDLASQVYQVFEQYTEGSDLKVGLAIGQTDFVKEQKDLTVNMQSKRFEDLQHRYLFEPDNAELAIEIYQISSTGLVIDKSAIGSRSNVDVLVCTPGRLVDHLDNTPGFSLQHLKFLVVDEADRLLNQRFHNWVDKVLESVDATCLSMLDKIRTNGNRLPEFDQPVSPITWRRVGASSLGGNEGISSFRSTVAKPVQLRKFLASATMTRDPQKLALLHLVNPKHFDVHQLGQDESGKDAQKYSVPENLSEHILECTAEQKPLLLFALIKDSLIRSGNDKPVVVVFTSSLDSTHRLARLLQLLWASSGAGECSAVVEFSSARNQHERQRLIERCNNQNSNVSVVVCSDGMSRGMDLERVHTVINYDVPSFAKTYVHRCGRTARAGKKGSAITLLKGGQTRQFERMRALINNPDRVEPIEVNAKIVRETLPAYRSSVKALKNVLEAEENGDIKPSDRILIDDYS